MRACTSALAFLAASATVRSAWGHGFMFEPPARNVQSGPKNGYCPHCGNGNGICGDGNQWPSDSDYVNAGTEPLRTWTAGSVVSASIRITAHHKGHFEFSVCRQQISSSTVDAQGCLDQWVLERATPEEAGIVNCGPNDRRGGCQPIDPRHRERWYLPPGGFSPDNNDVHTLYLKVPAGLSCAACTLQWRWWSANSCIPGPDYGCYKQELDAGGYNSPDWGLGNTCPGGGCNRCGCGEEFRNCADIAIVSSGGGGTTAPTMPPSTTASAGVTTTAGATTSGSIVPSCVSQEVLTCINGRSTFWPKCDVSQNKDVEGPAGYEYGLYCTKEWVDALNEMLSDPAVNKCNDQTAIHKLLAQVAYETAYFSTVYQPRDGGAGLIHMIPGNWPINVQDMDELFPGMNYLSQFNAFAPSQFQFFQSPQYGWKSVAAWYKRTNSVIPGCGQDLFDLSYEEQTRCILSRVVDRQEAFDIVGSCLSAAPSTSGTAAPTTVPPTVRPTTTTTTMTVSAGCRATADGRMQGGSDARCEAACSRLPAEAWPCAGQLCDCSSVPTTTQTAPATTRATTTPGSGELVCVPTQGLPPNGATVENCKRCANGYKWWPCNTEPAQCTCTAADSMAQVEVRRAMRSP
eukprot:CAMPEP_0181484300 /NCGR_PEP_ID=MMETSP1110-20121109/45910_1 /TAXON_ID=174948 /ORGANISM="Symbiodinium sp., Strain CCMP421" /LENGTH=628 /DNA_ID=CAMNT_0023610127 /DNA_START=47 /DNA_END=1933 /DNA_ORIENTATION=-